VRRALTASEQRHVERLRGVGELLDRSIRLPGGFRIGLDPIIGLVPGIGDLVGTGLSAWIILQSARLGASKGVLLRMLWNTGVESVFGMVPLLGDLFDFGWRANVKNLALLERHLDDPRAAARAGRSFLVGLGAALVALAVLTVWGLVQVSEAIGRMF
jgi:hypothetical protein